MNSTVKAAFPHGNVCRPRGDDEDHPFPSILWMVREISTSTVDSNRLFGKAFCKALAFFSSRRVMRMFCPPLFSRFMIASISPEVFPSPRSLQETFPQASIDGRPGCVPGLQREVISIGSWPHRPRFFPIFTLFSRFSSFWICIN